MRDDDTVTEAVSNEQTAVVRLSAGAYTSWAQYEPPKIKVRAGSAEITISVHGTVDPESMYAIRGRPLDEAGEPPYVPGLSDTGVLVSMEHLYHLVRCAAKLLAWSEITAEELVDRHDRSVERQENLEELITELTEYGYEPVPENVLD